MTSKSWNAPRGELLVWEPGEMFVIKLGDSARNAAPLPPVSGKVDTGAKNHAAKPLATDPLLRILMVEDSEDDCDLIRYHLRKCGYDVRLLRIFSEAEMCAALEQDQWDIVFTDHALPGFSGLEAIALLQKMGSPIPVLCVTGTHDPVIIRKILAAGARACVSKDDLSLLCTAVARALISPAVREQE